MTKSLSTTIGFVIVSAFALNALPGQDKPAPAIPAKVVTQDPIVPTKTPVAAPIETFSVVRTGGELKSMSATDLAVLRKTIEHEHAAAVRQWRAARLKAEKAHIKFSQVEPQARPLEVLGGPFNTAPEATAFRDQWVAAHAPKQDPAHGKSEPKNEPKNDTPRGDPKPGSPPPERHLPGR